MRVPISWLSEFVELKKTPEEIAEILTNSGHEVEEIFDPYKRLGEIITVKILKVHKPEDLKEVVVCEVTDGRDLFTVLTTARDQVKPNLIVALAKPGSFTFTHQKVETKEVKKYVSQGMFLSPFEAGIFEERNKLLTFEEGTPLGKSIYEVLNLFEPVLEVAITPNRGDLLSIYGIARELNLICNWELKPLEFSDNLRGGKVFPGKISIEDPEGCFRYAGRLFEGVQITESPFYLLKRLFLVGLRPINNIVDITNYVLIEIGQPLHAFDWSKIEGKEIVVRRARNGESLLMLDGVRRTFTEEDLVIADKSKALVLAGIMGGEDSGVNEFTQDIFLEAAWFNPKRIRLSSQRHKISTESSYRFERKVDPEGVLAGLLRATELIISIAQPKDFTEISDLYLQPYKSPTIEVPYKKITKILGFEVDKTFVDNTLPKLGEVKVLNDSYLITPHTFRQDLSIPEDIAEEIARLYGYDKIPTTIPWGELKAKPPSAELTLIRNLKNLFKSFGLFEVITYSFINPELLHKLNLPSEDKRMNYLQLSNPLSSQLSVMRTSLIPGLIECAKYNSAREVEDLAIFEIGKVFYPSQDLAEERIFLGILLKGEKKLLPWEGYKKKYDIFDIKGLLEEFIKYLRLPLEFRPFSTEPFLKRGMSYDLYLNEKKIGFAGAIKNLLLEDLDLKGPLFLAEIDLTALIPYYTNIKEKREIKKPPKYPSTFRDVSCVLDKKIPYTEILSYLVKLEIPYLERVELIALYEGEPIPEDKKSITLRFYYRAEERTLLVEEVNAIQDEVAKKLFEHFNAKPR